MLFNVVYCLTQWSHHRIEIQINKCMFDCRIISVRMKVLQLGCGLTQMGLSQFFVFNSFFF